MQVFSQLIQVKESDLDELHHVNNIRYVEWIQQISKEHWQNVVDENTKNNFIWVVRAHRITYHSAAKIDDELHLKTEIINSRGSISTRRVEMKDNKTNVLVVSSETDWCLLDPKNMKPIRIPETIKNLFITT